MNYRKYRAMNYIYRIQGETNIYKLQEMKKYWDEDNIESWAFFFCDPESSYDCDDMNQFWRRPHEYNGIDYKFRKTVLDLIDQRILFIENNSIDSDCEEEDDS